jgi:hypothetical protein
MLAAVQAGIREETRLKLKDANRDVYYGFIYRDNMKNDKWEKILINEKLKEHVNMQGRILRANRKEDGSSPSTFANVGILQFYRNAKRIYLMLNSRIQS